VSGLAFYFRDGSIDGGGNKNGKLQARNRAWASQHLFRATWHGMAWQCSQQLTGHLIPAQSCCCGFGATGEGDGDGDGEAGLEGWRAASPKILFICRPLVSCAVCTSPCSIQEMGSVVDRGGVENAGDAGLLFYWPSAVCERQRRLKKKRRLTPQGRPKEQLRMAALRQNYIMHLSSLPQPESKAGWAGLSIRQIESETSRRRGDEATLQPRTAFRPFSGALVAGGWWLVPWSNSSFLPTNPHPLFNATKIGSSRCGHCIDGLNPPRPNAIAIVAVSRSHGLTHVQDHQEEGP
jgi:hypothetical protein